MYVSLNTILYSPHCSPIFPSVFCREETTMCSKLFMQFGGCSTHFGSFCVYSSVHMLGGLLLLREMENHPSRKKKNSPLWVLCEDTSTFCSWCLWSCRIFMSLTHPALMTTICWWTQKVRIGKMCSVITGFGFFFFFFSENQAKNSLSFSYK